MPHAWQFCPNCKNLTANYICQREARCEECCECGAKATLVHRDSRGGALLRVTARVRDYTEKGAKAT